MTEITLGPEGPRRTARSNTDGRSRSVRIRTRQLGDGKPSPRPAASPVASSSSATRRFCGHRSYHSQRAPARPPKKAGRGNTLPRNRFPGRRCCTRAATAIAERPSPVVCPWQAMSPSDGQPVASDPASPGVDRVSAGRALEVLRGPTRGEPRQHRRRIDLPHTTSCGRADKHDHPKATHRPARRQAPMCLTAGDEDTFPRFRAFQRNQMHRSLRAGLPPQRHPLSGFLTLSAVCSRCTLAAVFQAASTRRLLGPSELFPPQSAAKSLDVALLSCHQVLHDADRANRLRLRRMKRSIWRTGWHVLRIAGDPGSRALLRPGIRHSARRVNVEQSRCSPGLLPLRGLPARPLGRTLPSCTYRRATSEEAPADGTTGSLSDRAWA